MTIRVVGLTLVAWLCVGCATQSSVRTDDWLGMDKAAHFAASAAMAVTVTNYKEHHGSSGCSAIRVGFVTSISAGAIKELYDKKIKKTFWSLADFSWDVLGASIGSLAAANC